MSEKLRTLPWYDRNAEVKIQRYAKTGIVPHSSTQRWTYTVPKGKNGFLESCQLQVQRLAPATTVGVAECMINYTPKGKSKDFLLHKAIMTNDAGDCQAAVLGYMGILFEGDNLEAKTNDTSVGGLCDYFIIVKITEFDIFPIELAPFQVELPKVDLQEPTITNIVERVLEEIKKFMG